jgi:cbb3-type cytochrome oxidase subunit 3
MSHVFFGYLQMCLFTVSNIHDHILIAPCLADFLSNFRILISLCVYVLVTHALRTCARELFSREREGIFIVVDAGVPYRVFRAGHRSVLDMHARLFVLVIIPILRLTVIFSMKIRRSLIGRLAAF